MQKQKQKTEHCLKLWLKYKPDHARTQDGTVTLVKYFLPSQTNTRQGHYRRMITHIARRRDQGYIWQARIYEQPGNREIFTWREDQNQTAYPAILLDVMETSNELDPIEEMEIQKLQRQ